MTKREHLPAIAAALDAEGALPRLIVYAAPDAAHCDHATCRRRRGEPPIPRKTPPRAPAPRTPAVFGPMLGLAEAMEQHPQLSDEGMGIGRYRGLHRAELAANRTSLAGREASVLEIAAWLRGNIAPVKIPTVGSCDMKHVVENAIGRYVSNGEFIAAALIAGYPHRYADGPNAQFGMSARDVRRMRNVGGSAPSA